MNKTGELTAYFERSELAIRASPLSGKIYSAYGIEPKYHITVIEVLDKYKEEKWHQEYS